MECNYCNSKPCICNFPEKIESIRILQLDTPTKNGHIYPKKEIEKSLLNLPSSIKYGMIGMPIDGKINLEDVSHFVENVRIDGDWLVCDIQALDTSKGKLLKQMYLLMYGDFRTVGKGNYDLDTKEISNFTLMGVHYVEDPA